MHETSYTSITSATSATTIDAAIAEAVKSRIATDLRNGVQFTSYLHVAGVAAEYSMDQFRSRYEGMKAYAHEQISQHVSRRVVMEERVAQMQAHIRHIEAQMEDLLDAHPNLVIRNLRETNKRLADYSNEMFMQVAQSQHELAA